MLIRSNISNVLCLIKSLNFVPVCFIDYKQNFKTDNFCHISIVYIYDYHGHFKFVLRVSGKTIIARHESIPNL